MATNAIVKVRSGTRSFSERGVRYGKAWAFICPVCPEARPDYQHTRYYGRNSNTRKAAKDALHQHMLTNHPAPQ